MFLIECISIVLYIYYYIGGLNRFYEGEQKPEQQRIVLIYIEFIEETDGIILI